jgi:hypothetical protein
MRILFCNDDFPGHFEALASMLSAMPEHDVVFASLYGRRDFSLPGVRRAILKPFRKRPSREGDEVVQEWGRAVSAGRLALSSFQTLAGNGFVPDMILFSSGAGISLFLERAFPSSFRVAYIDSSLPRRIQSGEPDRNLAVHMVQSTVLFQCHKAYAFSPRHASAMPGLTGQLVESLAPCVDTGFFSREKAELFRCEGLEGHAPLITIELRGGIGVSQGFITAVLGLLVHRPECHVLFLCSTEQACLKLREAFAGLGDVNQRIHAREVVKRADFRDALCASSIYICPTGTGLTLEKMAAMSCGTVLIAPLCGDSRADAAMLALPSDPKALFSILCSTLDDQPSMERLSVEARRAMLETCEQEPILRKHVNDLFKAYEEWRQVKA